MFPIIEYIFSGAGRLKSDKETCSTVTIDPGQIEPWATFLSGHAMKGVFDRHSQQVCRLVIPYGIDMTLQRTNC
jgi:hypothetical protein